jgi:hypothetical protein
MAAETHRHAREWSRSDFSGCYPAAVSDPVTTVDCGNGFSFFPDGFYGLFAGQSGHLPGPEGNWSFSPFAPGKLLGPRFQK